MVRARRKTLAPAIADLERAYALAPESNYLLGDLFHLHMYAGDWRSFAADRAALDEGVAAGRPVANPFVYCGIADSPELLLSCVRVYTGRKFPPQTPLPSGTARRVGKIRVGYLCGEFRAQATAYLTAGLFEAHDRERFDIIAIDNTLDDGSAMRQRLLTAFGSGRIDISNESDAQAAAKIAAADIDILVNLNGYFGRMRMGVCARRPAPLQVNYLGFPSSLGAPYMDYILADGVVIPDGEDAFYAEKIVRLPHSYQINDEHARHCIRAARARANWGCRRTALSSVTSIPATRSRRRLSLPGCESCRRWRAACYGCWTPILCSPPTCGARRRQGVLIPRV